MTRDEARDHLLHLLGGVRSEMEAHGWRLELYNQTATLRPIDPLPLDGLPTPTTPPHSPDTPGQGVGGAGVLVGPLVGGFVGALAVAMSGATGNLCPACQTPTRPAGACELCPNCGQTSSCG